MLCCARAETTTAIDGHGSSPLCSYAGRHNIVANVAGWRLMAKEGCDVKQG